eukprot:UN13948
MPAVTCSQKKVSKSSRFIASKSLNWVRVALFHLFPFNRGFFSKL